jgi:hypothetical protein
MLADTLCTHTAALQCDAEQRCCTAPGRSRDACLTAAKQTCASTLYLDELAANASTGFDSEAADAFFAELASRLQACDPTAPRWSARRGGLRTIFNGTLDAAQSCKPAQALTADKPTQAAALLACRDAENTSCLPASLLGDWTCSAHSATDGSCLTEDNCQDDAYCDNPQQTFGKCQTRIRDGESCSDGLQCDSLRCVDGKCISPDAQLAYCPATP